MAPKENELSAEEVIRFLEVVREFDVEAVKFTGGEPLLREDLIEIVRGVPDGMTASITTNGTYLPKRAKSLKNAGLQRVNVSQDALDPADFRALTQSGAYESVLEGVRAAVDAGLTPVKLNMVVFEKTAGYIPEMVDHVANNDGLQLQLIEFMPELVGRPEWAIDMDRVHGWLTEQADRRENREMHHRTRYWVDGGMIEVVDPVENPEFCANCHRVRLTHEGYLKGCLNRNDDLRSMGSLSKAEIREAFRETVANRVPYYGEYMIQDEDGTWTVNPEYMDAVPTPTPDGGEELN